MSVIKKHNSSVMAATLSRKSLKLRYRTGCRCLIGLRETNMKMVKYDNNDCATLVEADQVFGNASKAWTVIRPSIVDQFYVADLHFCSAICAIETLKTKEERS